MGFLVSNHDWTHGELDPIMYARSDLEFYNKSAKKIQNMVVLPGGSAKTRFGTKYISTLTTSNEKLLTWKAESYSYILVCNDGNILLYSAINDTYMDAIDYNHGNAVRFNLLRSAQDKHEFIIVSQYAEPLVLTSNTDGSVSSNNYTYKNPPHYEYPY